MKLATFLYVSFSLFSSVTSLSENPSQEPGARIQDGKIEARSAVRSGPVTRSRTRPQIQPVLSRKTQLASQGRITKPKPKPKPTALRRSKPPPQRQAQPFDAKSVLVFDCASSKETCNTMCFGLKCATKRASWQTLTWDNPSATIAGRRRTTAGCNVSGAPNRCRVGAFSAGTHNCDEFPFASTKNADSGGQINRCVIVRENSSQGGKLGGFQRSPLGCGNKFPCNFRIAFKNEGPYKYCKARPDCKPDGNIFTSRKAYGTKRKRDEKSAATLETGGQYMLESGETIFSPYELEVGSLVTKQRPSNSTLQDEIMTEARSLFGRSLESLEDEETIAEIAQDLEMEKNYVIDKVRRKL